MKINYNRTEYMCIGSNLVGFNNQNIAKKYMRIVMSEIGTITEYLEKKFLSGATTPFCDME